MEDSRPVNQANIQALRTEFPARYLSIFGDGIERRISGFPRAATERISQASIAAPVTALAALREPI